MTDNSWMEIPWPGCMLPDRGDPHTNEFVEMVIEMAMDAGEMTPDQAAEMRRDAQEAWEITPGVRTKTKYGEPAQVFKTRQDFEEWRNNQCQ